MSIFDNLGKGGNTPAPAQPQNPMAFIQQNLTELKSNPIRFLQQAGFNVPDNITDPQSMLNHLMRSGQVDGGRYQQVMQFMQGMRR